ncbi:hypothetical protein V1L54_01405 [Streptomyces sp. TRM 70361]|uniref:hypothetical protein n=1 Tax=Streptomyces sp. TRM 70361 TaxID=3116553 RepID=UPI002E7B9FBC|nr:hypothetical protein [Streptomyces sp. TRM 70361]MEE1938086.1 hypothetical protein [Streptomyces sp. TRM 70361]
MPISSIRGPATVCLLASGILTLTACADGTGLRTEREAEPATLSAGEPEAVVGDLYYVAPGQIRVGERVVTLTEETAIWGMGRLCGEPGAERPTRCTMEQFRASLMDGDIRVRVLTEGDRAVEILDEHVLRDPAGTGRGTEEDTEEDRDGSERTTGP